MSQSLQVPVQEQSSPKQRELLLEISDSDDDRNSTTPSDHALNVDADAFVKQSVVLYKEGREKIETIDLSMVAQPLDDERPSSPMKTIPVEVDDLKENFSYYKERLYQKFSVKMSDLVRLEIIGKGAFGEVIRVFNKTDRKFYALKEVKRYSFKKDIYYESAIWTEMQNLLKVSQAQNPSLLKTILIDFNNEEQDICYLMMEYGKGTLEEYAECKRRYASSWTEKELEYILSQLINQYIMLKNLGMCHRDIKPSNVIISSGENCLKLSDLGCACLAEEGLQKQNITGTPHFMSPEIIQAMQKRKLIVDHDPYLSDLYSIGVTILTLLDPSLNRRDFDDYMNKKVKEYYPNIHPVLQDLLSEPEKRRDAIKKMAQLKVTYNDYRQLEAASVGEKYKLYLYCKIVAKNKNIDTSFYFDMFILDDAFLVIREQISLLNEKMKEGDQNLEVIIWRIRLARCYYLQRKYEEALKELESLLKRKELKSFEGKNLLIKAGALLWLGIVKVKLGQLEEAFDHLMHCLGVRVSELGEVHEDVSAVYWQLGDTFLTEENRDSAKKAFEKCIQIGQKLDIKERRYEAKSYHSLGGMAIKTENYELAFDYYEKAKDLFLKIYGEHHPTVADQYLAIGFVHIVSDKPEEGVLFSTKALEMKIRWYGENNPEVAIAYTRLAEIYERLGQYGKVKEFLEKSISIWKAVTGSNSYEIANAYHLIAGALCRRGQYKKGLKFAAKVIIIKEDQLGVGHPRLAIDYLHHAETCHVLGKREDKKSSLAKFMNVDLNSLGQNVNTIKLLLRVSRLLGEDNKVKEAWEYATRGYRMSQGLSIPKTSKVYADYYETVGRIRKTEGDYETAAENLKKAIVIRNKLHLGDYDVLARLYSLMGELYDKLKRYDESLEWYTKSANIVEEHLCKESLIMVKGLFNLGKVLKTAQKNEEIQEKLSIFTKFLKHIDTKLENDSCTDYEENVNGE